MKNTQHEMFVILFIGAQSPECTWAETTFVYCSHYQHLLYLKKCTLLFTPCALVYGLYASEDVDNCEQPLSLIYMIYTYPR